MNIKVSLKRSSTVLKIGRRGEHMATTVAFDVSDFTAYGQGVCVLLHQRDGDRKPYLVAKADRAEDVLTWTVTATDTAYPGRGRCELQYMVDDVVAKSVTFVTMVEESMAEPTEVEEATDEWLSGVLSQVAELGKNTAAEYAETAGFVAKNTIMTDEDIQALLKGDTGVGIAQMETTTSTENGGENTLTVTLTDGTATTLTVLNGEKGETGEQGIQGEKGDKGDTGEQGIQGEKGDKGDTGEDGVGIFKMETTTSTENGGENTLTVTLTDGSATTLTVLNGEKGETGEKGDTGEQGIQGIQGIQGEKGDQGEKGEQGIQGIQGEKGDKGDTGDSYTITEADYAAIAALVLTQMDDSEEVAY